MSKNKNKSEAVKARIFYIVLKLVVIANENEKPDREKSRKDSSLQVRWKESDRTQSEKILVECSTKEFTELFYSDRGNPETEKSDLVKLAAERVNSLNRSDLQSSADAADNKDKSKQTGKLNTDRNNDIGVLKDLGIFEDLRFQTKGKKDLHFTLTLWSRNEKIDRDRLEELWSAYKRNGDISKRLGKIVHNLPNNNCADFVGYKKQRDLLMNTLILNSRNHNKLIAIEGIAGSGKTSLVLDVVRQDNIINRFEAILFTSAQPSTCLPQSIVRRLQIERNLTDILREISIVLNPVDIIPTELSQLLAIAKKALAAQKTLLIIDNIENNDDRENLYAFLHELPDSVTTILTSRCKLGFGKNITLSGLDELESKKLINNIAIQKELSVTDAEKDSIWHITSGIPLAIDYIMSNARISGSIAALDLDRDMLQKTDISRYCFNDLLERIRGDFRYRILLAIAIFSHEAAEEAVLYVCQLTMPDMLITVRNAIHDLQYWHLLLTPKYKYYSLHSLTREYSRDELSKDATYEATCRDRWIDYYHQYTEPYGKLVWCEWQDYTALESEWLNIRDVVEYCIEDDRLEDFQRLWQNLHGYTLISGQWRERFKWLEWWESNLEEENESLAVARYHRSQTFAHRDESDADGKALQMALNAWDCCHNLDLNTATHFNLQFDIVLHIAALYIRQPQHQSQLNFLQAEKWLKLSLELLAKGIAPREDSWYRSQILYYQAEIEHSGGNYPQAKELYQQTIELAKAVKFNRLISYASSRIAIGAIATKELTIALTQFEDVLSQAKEQKDRRSIALSYFYLATIELKRGNRHSARKYARDAVESCERLSMDRYAQEAQKILGEI
jgi:tetratricopeptide (TPR) repeat protein